jgi:hypothetical protein
MLGDGWAGVDFDDCRDLESGELDGNVPHFLDLLRTYAEISPSGTGIKVICRGKLPKGPRHNRAGTIEMYDEGRYFTITGHALHGVPLHVHRLDRELAQLYYAVIGGDRECGLVKPHEANGHAGGNDRDLAVESLGYVSRSRADRYGDWLLVGMAMRSVSPDLVGEWDSWSQHSHKYQPGVCQEKWATFASDGAGGVGIGSLIHWAREDGGYDPRHKPNGVEKSGPPLVAVSFHELAVQNPKLHEPVIEGLLRIGETCNVIAPSKIGKSWLSYGLALSIVTGSPWLDTFNTRPGNVLLIDNELHPPTIVGRIPTVADALAIQRGEYEDKLDVLSLRGRLVDFHGLKNFVAPVEPGQYQVVIVDAYYRMLPPKISENDNAEIAAIYNLIDQYAAKTGAAWILIHHTTKGSQAEKSVTDVGAGAGSQSRAADTHLILRPHEEEGCIILEAAVRSWPPVEPMPLRWAFPVWVPAQGLDPTKLKGRQTKQEERQRERDEEGKVLIAQVLKERSAATANKIAGDAGMGKERCNRLLRMMRAAKEVGRRNVVVHGNEAEEYFLTQHEGAAYK